MKRWSMKAAGLLAICMLILVMTACGSVGNSSSGKNSKGSDHKYVIGWSTIYLTPSWMQQTNKMLMDRGEYWKEKGLLDKIVVANANGDTSVQISQIENMISQKYDAILVVAGSSTALNPVLEKAVDAGIPVINFDSLVTSDKITSKINTDQTQYGVQTAQWLVDKLGGKGKVIAMNGPAGVAVSDERWAGAKSVFDKYPDISVVANISTEYNEGPALQAILPALSANPDVDGIYSQGGALSSAAVKGLQQNNMKMIPMPGENYNGFLRLWDSLRDQGFSSYAVGQPNWLSVLSLDQAIRALQGQKVEKNVIVPLPVIDDNNLKDFVPNDHPDDYFPIRDITEDEIIQILGPAE